MSGNYFDYKILLDNFLSRPIKEQIMQTEFFIDKKIMAEFENNELYKLMSENKYIDERRYYDTYLFGVLDNKLKIVQRSTNYILDDLLTIQDFLTSSDIDFFKENLRKTYWITEKTQKRYIKKSEKRGLDTLYGSYSVGANILNYLYDKKKRYNVLGDRYGIENQIMNNLCMEDEEFIKHKLIIVMNFDYDIIEVYDSIPYDLLQKGTAELEAESIFGTYFDNFNYQEFFERLED